MTKIVFLFHLRHLIDHLLNKTLLITAHLLQLIYSVTISLQVIPYQSPLPYL